MKSILSILGAAAVACLAVCGSVRAAQYDVLYVFASRINGDTPRGTLFRDSAGNLYGTTVFGGYWNGQSGCECGNIFKLAPNGTETVLYTFQDKNDGGYPYSGVVRDSAGNLYGTTYGDQFNNFGSVYRLNPQGALTTLHAFCARPHCTDGSFPLGGVVRDSRGDLFGATGTGGANGYGAIFSYAANGTFTVLYSFRDGNDGGYPLADILRDAKGNIYGTASQGGIYGGGTVFKFTASRHYQILHSFNGADGNYPEFRLREDAAGNLYGQTSAGGNTLCGGSGCGTIFKLAPDGTFTTLYTFKGRSDGSWPSGPVLDSSGNLYGASRVGSSQRYQGAIFEIATDGSFSIIHSVTCLQDGCIPYDNLIMDNSGNLYGTMAESGTNSCEGYYCGTVFKVVP